MRSPEPAPDPRRDLYDAAAAFRNLAPWRWMSDEELFAVRDPGTGETLFCCVLGALGEVLGMVVYPGADGYRLYRRMRRGEYHPDHPDLSLHLRTLNVEFEDRAALEARDRKVLRELGLSFHGPRAWPLFRSYRPLLYPWYLSAEETLQLTVALRQAVEVGRRAKDDRKLFEAPDGKSILTRQESGAGWSDIWTPPPPEMDEPPRLPLCRRRTLSPFGKPPASAPPSGRPISRPPRHGSAPGRSFVRTSPCSACWPTTIQEGSWRRTWRNRTIRPAFFATGS